VTEREEEKDRRGAVRLDLLGLVCPVPVTRLQECAAALPAGALIELEADDGGIQWDLPAWCLGQGHTLLRLEEAGGIWRGAVRLGGPDLSARTAGGTSPTRPG
jgi:tRNA 2-thiouridine synthesizing protein A